MDQVVAYKLLATELSAYGTTPYQELCQLVGEQTTRIVRGADGVDYELSVHVRWRLSANSDIRVIASIWEVSNWGGPHERLDDTVVVHSAALQ
jgi:hypothetical protein